MTAPTWKMERRALASLRPFEHNPRRIMEKPLADLTKSIGKFGLAEPLVCQPDGLLIGGHARYQVLLAQGVKEADCYVPDRALSQRDMIELNVRLNKNVAGEWDFDVLANTLDIADLVSYGFSEEDLLGVDVDNPKLSEKKEMIAPRKMLRVLISVPVEKAAEAKPLVDACIAVEGVQVLQGAN